jgi:hypothetical protein
MHVAIMEIEIIDFFILLFLIVKKSFFIIPRGVRNIKAKKCGLVFFKMELDKKLVGGKMKTCRCKF